MHEHATDTGEKKKFPEAIKLAVGDSVVALALEIEQGIRTRNGTGTVVRVVLRGNTDEIRTIWWPKKLPLPGLSGPFLLKKVGEFDYVLSVPSTREEEEDLWKLGKCSASVAEVGRDGIPPAARSIIDRFRALK